MMRLIITFLKQNVGDITDIADLILLQLQIPHFLSKSTNVLSEIKLIYDRLKKIPDDKVIAK